MCEIFSSEPMRFIGKITFILLSFTLLKFELLGQAPNDINFKTLEVTITNAEGDEFIDFKDNKVHLITNSSKLAGIVPLNDQLEGGAGLYQFKKIDNNNASLNIETNIGTIRCNLKFITDKLGEIAISIQQEPENKMSGNFIIQKGKSMTYQNFVAKEFLCIVTDGSGAYASRGAFLFKPRSDGYYVAEKILRIPRSVGKFNYKNNSTSTAELSYTDSRVGEGVTLNLNWTDESNGSYFIYGLGHQTGTFKTINKYDGSVPLIIQQPKLYNMPNNEKKLTVYATSDSPLNYQWYRNNKILNFQDEAEIIFSDTEYGVYKVKVFNESGTVFSNEVSYGEITNDEYLDPTKVLEFEIDGNYARIIGSDLSMAGKLKIPEFYKGKLVKGNVGFWDATNLVEIIIPKNVHLGWMPFHGCNKLKNIHIENDHPDYSSLDGVLYNKNRTDLIRVPAGKTGHYNAPATVINIYAEAFYDSSLSSINLHNNITFPDGNGGMFVRNKNLKSIKLPDDLGISGIGNNMFYDCIELESINIPKSATRIGDWAFKGCKKLKEVFIPENVDYIGRMIFSSCDNFRDIKVDKNNKRWASIDGVMFSKDQTGLVNFPNGRMGHYSIPDSVTSIWRNAFIGCSSLTSVTIPDSVTRIEAHAFNGCSSLTSVAIPDSVTSIALGAFEGCSSLTSVAIPDRVTSIGKHAFSRCSSLMSVTIPDSVTSVGNYAFIGCSSLKSVTFEGSAPALGRNVFDVISENAKIYINPGATGFGEMFAGLPVHIINNFKINSFNNFNNLFEIRFETKSDSTYTIEVTQDFLKWDEIGEIKGTGNTVRFIDPRLPVVPFKRNFFRVKEEQ